MNWRLADPYLLLLLVPLAALAAVVWRRRIQRPRMTFSSVALFSGARRTLRSRMLRLPLILTLLCCALLVGALARPQSVGRENKNETEGIDIMLVLDVSDSMATLDFTPNRLEKAKQVVKEFISRRKYDRIGVVIFGRDTFTLAPLTQDYKALEGFVDRIDFDLVNGTRTAIGMGLANAVNQLRKSKAKSKVVILLTDGENNAGRIDPLDAAQVAQAFDVHVYTIGVGSDGEHSAPDPANPMQLMRVISSLDVDTLTKMAEMTKGHFFRATDDASLEQIYKEIDGMVKTKIEFNETYSYDELAGELILPALILLILGLALESTWLRTFP